MTSRMDDFRCRPLEHGHKVMLNKHTIVISHIQARKSENLTLFFGEKRSILDYVIIVCLSGHRRFMLHVPARGHTCVINHTIKFTNVHPVENYDEFCLFLHPSASAPYHLAAVDQCLVGRNIDS